MFDELRAWSPLYRDLLEHQPGLESWLIEQAGRDWRRPDFAVEFEAETRKRALTAGLRRFRRRASMRIAAREVGNLCDVRQSLNELTLLAEFVLGKVLDELQATWERRLGVPWDHEVDRPARFCVLGLGKFGGGELNFCSDLDLIYIYEGEGHCKKGGHVTAMANAEFFARLAQDLTAQLQQRTADGFLYNIDLRLRPEGDGGPLVRSLDAMEHYYYAAGQTWERLALIKARPVAGTGALAEELFERLNPFRFPRHPPPRLIERIAAVKQRTENEVIGATLLDRDLKSGPGGIREIEFFVQALQMLNGGRNPFLQESSTMGALEKLDRYHLVETDRAAFLRDAYLRLRRLENLVQCREEKQTHALPTDPAMVKMLNGIGPLEGLDAVRAAVRANYQDLFPSTGDQSELAAWTAFFSGATSETIGGHIRGWLGSAPEAERRVREFVSGESAHVLTREQVELFVELTCHFDRIFAGLASPLEVLKRISAFSRRYGLPTQFLKACHSNPRFFEALCTLFDRSRFIYELLLEHPEIIDEVLGQVYLRDKTVVQHRNEIRRGPRGGEFGEWLRLYVKAEEVRFVVRELLGGGKGSLVSTSAQLGMLANAVIAEVLARCHADHRLAVIGLGKCGAGELTFGSDLDLVVIGKEQEEGVTRFLKLLRHAYAVDLRLRPWGDAGALVVTEPAFREYPLAIWERMAWTRARPITGSHTLIDPFMAAVDDRVFGPSLTDGDLVRIGEIRALMERENGQSSIEGELSFKAGRGGLVDIEYLVQRHQLSRGLRGSDLRALLVQLADAGAISQAVAGALRKNYEFFRSIEHAVRRDENASVSALRPDKVDAVAKWIGFSGDLAAELRSCLEETRTLVRDSIDVPSFPP
ncbi:MAG: hypothetical protein ACR2OZ_17690 [Verrucomicrobiales bacterium]